jgi:CheY-like chemotaxis protein/anti-sigma regulatory factor (Ser/Thr protein kinase)
MRAQGGSRAAAARPDIMPTREDYAEDASEEDDKGPPANLLIVDDEPANLIALSAVLEPLGQRIVTARSGHEALKHVLADDFAVILMDVQMPGMDGFEVAQLIKERDRSRHVPILFITALNREERYVFRGYSVGAVDYLSKPVDPDILRAKVSVFVELHQKNERLKRQTELLHQAVLREAQLKQELREREMLQNHLAELAERDNQQRRFVREVLLSVSEGRLHICDRAEELPEPLPPYCDPVELDKPTLRTLRRNVRAAAEAAGWSDERLHELESAVGEAAMNAVVHAGGGEGRVHFDPSTGKVQVWVHDHGTGIHEAALHRATMERGFTTAGTLGHGFWMMHRLADRVHLLTGPSGTTIVLEQGKEPPEPAWLRQHAY